MLRPVLLALMAGCCAVVSTPATAAPAGSPTASLGVDGFLLGALDQIEVNIVNFPDLKTQTRIASDGTINLPLVGEMAVAGLSRTAAAQAIAARYAAGGYVKAPSVRIEILDYQSRKASVLGQVNAQGLVTLDRAYSVAEIIARAGGLGPDAGDAAIIVRQTAGRTERITVKLDELTGGATHSPALAPIQPGDVIFVPRADTFSVVGAVRNAGNFRLTGSMTVQQALAAAGDISMVGTISGLKIRRKSPDGTSAMNVPAALDDPMRPGDVLIVRERMF